MSGVCGFLGDDRTALLEQMSAAIAHRGPDVASSWFDPAHRVGLAHRLLACQQGSAGEAQPVPNAGGTVRMGCDGTLFDRAAQARWLEGRGRSLALGTGDAALLLALYDEKGLAFLEDVNGAFALALWDSARRRLLLARDHVGMRPLYYWQDGPRIYFASELKALTRIPELSRSLDLEVLPMYLRFLWVPGPATMLRGVRKVEPGHQVVWEDGRLTSRRWFAMQWSPDETVTPREWAEEARSTLHDAVRRQSSSTRSLGSFLSGGMDTSSIVACLRAQRPGEDLRVYTAAPDGAAMSREGFGDDCVFAKLVARHFDLTLRSFAFDAAQVSHLPEAVFHMDEPDADPAILACYGVGRLARADGIDVLLSGAGGDESFFGYRSHIAYRAYERLDWLPPAACRAVFSLSSRASARVLGADAWLPRRLRKFGNGLAARGLARHLELVDWSSAAARATLLRPEVLREIQDRTPDCFGAYWQGFDGTGEINRHTWLLLLTFLGAHDLVYNDKTCMANGVEVRMPFLDREVLRLVARIPEGQKLHRGMRKFVLRSAMSPGMPEGLFDRRKTPFAAPLRSWLKRDLQPLVTEMVSERRVVGRGLFDWPGIRRVLADNDANRADHSYLVYALLTLEIWQETFIDRPGVRLQA